MIGLVPMSASLGVPPLGGHPMSDLNMPILAALASSRPFASSFPATCPATIRGKMRFFTYKPDISGHFLPLIWVKWVMFHSFLTQHRHFVRQSLNTPPPLTGHFRTFPDIFSPFVTFPTSTWMAWHDNSSLFRQYRHLALQSEFPPLSPDRTFARFYEKLPVFFARFHPFPKESRAVPPRFPRIHRPQICAPARCGNHDQAFVFPIPIVMIGAGSTYIWPTH